MGNTQGNDGSGNIEERDNWETPKWLFNKLDEQYNFDVDCCASPRNKKTFNFSNNFLNSPVIETFECAWMNPPFSKATEMFEHFFKIVRKGVCIYRCDNLETKLWQEVILKNATWILIPNGRISYEGKAGKGSRFPSALIGFNVEPPKEVEGTILIIKLNSPKP
jgi:hypothetical protein